MRSSAPFIPIARTSMSGPRQRNRSGLFSRASQNRLDHFTTYAIMVQMEQRPRLYTEILADHLRRHRQMALVSGPRQVGKTTTCRSISDAYLNWDNRSEEHTSELQSRLHLVCRLLLEKKKCTQILQFSHALSETALADCHCVWQQ